MECNTWFSSSSSSSMSFLLLASAVAVVLLALISWWATAAERRHGWRRLPPGPAGWPVIGNMLDLGRNPHSSLYNLKAKYGPVVWLRLGSVNTMVIQSSRAAAELFEKHDRNFSDRKVPNAATVLGFNEGSLSTGSYNPHWVALKRLCSMALHSGKELEDAAIRRKKCADDMVRWIEEEVMASRSLGGNGEVEIRKFLFLMSFNVVANHVLSKDLLKPRTGERHDFLDAVEMFQVWIGTPNVADFVPGLKWLDPMRIKANTKRAMGRCMKIVDGYVKERIQEKKMKEESSNECLLDTLLKYQGGDGKLGLGKISDWNISIVILEMFMAGSNAPTSTVEWAISELLRNPETMRKAKDELDRVIGPNKKLQEKDIDKLPYLCAVLKETLRLHPPGPLLIPRNSVEDCKYMGYDIPKNTQLLVNVWAIARDPECWKEPFAFIPERFLDKNINYKGKHYDYLPFGSGRRMCVGHSLAHRLIHLSLATLLNSFDWELSESVSPELLDMNENIGINPNRLVPLKVIPTKRSTPIT